MHAFGLSNHQLHFINKFYLKVAYHSENCAICNKIKCFENNSDEPKYNNK